VEGGGARSGDENARARLITIFMQKMKEKGSIRRRKTLWSEMEEEAMYRRNVSLIIRVLFHGRTLRDPRKRASLPLSEICFLCSCL
jgi:hypothetical protein